MTTEILVIGSGPGGAVTATLCAEAGRSVMMIEEGPDLPVSSAAPFSREERLQKYRGAGIGIAMGAAKIAYVEGRCVGGGSEVNRGLYHRTPASVLERWREDYRVQDRSAAALAPHFEACEATARVEHLPGPAPGISTRLGAGAAALGWAATPTARLNIYDHSEPNSGKQSMSRTFVPRFRAAGGRLLADLRAWRIVRSGSGWTVEAEHTPADDPPRAVLIRAERVYVACGAVQTPALLRRSGIRHNIGSSLRFHTMLKAVAEFDDEVNLPGDLDPVHQIREFEPDIGIGCSISSPSMLALALNGNPEGLARVPDRWRRMGIYYVQSSAGKAKVRNLPFVRDPLVTVDYAKDDLATLTGGFHRMVEALFAAGARRVYPAVAHVPALESPADLAHLPALAARDGSLSAVHVFSSCPMGENMARCATDSFGRVHGVEGLYIADASLLCGPTSVNPQGTVMAIAHRNARHALESGWQCRRAAHSAAPAEAVV